VSHPPALEVSVTISTFRRPEGLRRLLEALGKLDASSPRFEVIVVDNDAGESARSIVGSAPGRAFELRYLVEPVQSIARARSRGVREATGSFVAFIDDDEWPDPRWLVEMWRVAQETEADGVIGPVRSVLPATAPRWLAEGGVFQRPILETGKPLVWWQTTTANALVRRASLLALPMLFDDAFGLTGGSDSELFHRMLARGARLVGSGEGVVHEAVEPSRANAVWLLKRHFRNGMISARLSGRRHAALRTLRHAAEALLSLRAGRVARFRHLLASTHALGEVAQAAGLRYEPYRVPKGPVTQGAARDV